MGGHLSGDRALVRKDCGNPGNYVLGWLTAMVSVVLAIIKQRKPQLMKHLK